ncbi:uncharacterized protein LOC107322262 isoform X1 [Coturnix japonica]|uniref:uncharacterized protein LOC107322262 isoform X1 n=1 Tax=Coturnix japonica TaxID=93934 RepID=UPI000777230F|nr:uncharacterized protein LOC107322262 isoform X1 [Coturnix japonica]
MAAREPLLSALKGAVLRLRSDGVPCSDSSPHLAAVCALLEGALRKGLRQPLWGFGRRDYWHCLEQLPLGRPSPLSSSLHRASICTKALTAQGRGRCFLRSALQGKVLAVAVQQLVQSPRLLEFYDPSGSILGNEELREPFLSLVLVLMEVDFSLDLQNCSFLDESWLLPVCVMYETVPCRALGMVVRYVDGRVIVIEVLPGSQAEVDEVVLAGDVLDEINGCSLRNAYSGQAGVMLQKLKGQPLSLRVLRWQGHSGEVYEPLLPYLQAVKEKEPHFQLQCGPRHRDKGEKQRVQGGRLLYNLRYLGRISVGMFGGKEVLQKAIPAVLESCSAPREVLFDVKETEILVQEKASPKVLFRHPYPAVSCVGRCLKTSHVFAFCVVLMCLLPYLVLPQGALKGARLSAWCLHRVQSKNARKSSRESLQDSNTPSGLSDKGHQALAPQAGVRRVLQDFMLLCMNCCPFVWPLQWNKSSRSGLCCSLCNFCLNFSLTRYSLFSRTSPAL